MLAFIKRIIAVSFLCFVYGFCILLTTIASLFSTKKWNRSSRILIIATFHNTNWFTSHIRPIVNSNYGEVILVCDEEIVQIDNVVYECPPRLLSKIFSRAGAKFFWGIRCGFKYRPDLYMGYHIFPGAISALILGKLFRRPSCYQDTSGPLELSGGGWNAENTILRWLGKPSRLVERVLFKTLKGFDLIIVRGKKARKFIQNTGFINQLEIVTAGVQFQDNITTNDKRDIDVVFVGRLSETKRIDNILQIVSKLKQQLPDVNISLIGDGPLLDQLTEMSMELNIQSNVQFLGKKNNVGDYLYRSKIFILTSRWEGVSIAMIEAMMAGNVPVVSNVGDLGDLVVNKESGYLIDENNLDDFSENIYNLLSDTDLWARISAQALSTAKNTCELGIVSSNWAKHINQVTENAGGVSE